MQPGKYNLSLTIEPAIEQPPEEAEGQILEVQSKHNQVIFRCENGVMKIILIYLESNLEEAIIEISTILLVLAKSTELGIMLMRTLQDLYNANPDNRVYKDVLYILQTQLAKQIVMPVIAPQDVTKNIWQKMANASDADNNHDDEMD